MSRLAEMLDSNLKNFSRLAKEIPNSLTYLRGLGGIVFGLGGIVLASSL